MKSLTCLPFFLLSILLAACNEPARSTESRPAASSAITTEPEEMAASENGHIDADAQKVDTAQTDDQVGQVSEAKVDVSVVDLAGLRKTVEGLRGKIVVVDIWSTSCLPCMREFPNLVELSRQYPDALGCISLNVDYIGIKSKPPESYVPKVEEFLSKKEAVTTINFVSSVPDSDVLTEFEAESIPAILIFGPDGQLQHKLTDANSGADGLTYEGDVIPKVEELLEGN